MTTAAMAEPAGMQSRVARARGDGRPHHRRGIAVLGVRGRVSLLHRQEPERAVPAATCSSCPCSAPSASCRAASSSALGSRALSRGDVRASGRWLAVTWLLGAVFLAGTAREWYGLIYRQHLTIGTNLFGTTFYPLVGLHASHVIVGLVMLGLCSAFAWSGALRPAHARAGRDGVLVLALRRRGVGRGVHRRVRDRPMTPEPDAGHARDCPRPPRGPWCWRSASRWPSRGLVTHVSVSAVGAVLALSAAVGWWRQVLPVEQRRARAAPSARRARAGPSAPSTRVVGRLRLGEGGHRMHLPVQVPPLSSGVVGGLVGRRGDGGGGTGLWAHRPAAASGIP